MKGIGWVILAAVGVYLLTRAKMPAGGSPPPSISGVASRTVSLENDRRARRMSQTRIRGQG